MDWEYQLISDYMTIEKVLQTVAPECLGRTGPNQISDTEVLSIYFWGIKSGCRDLSATYRLTASYLKDWYPNLPCYQQYDKRLNRLTEILELIFGVLSLADRKNADVAVIDSMPIIVAGAKRSSRAKVAKNLCAKGFCSSKNMYYYGCKLHLVVNGDRNKAPYDMLLGDITPANDHDINFLKKNHLAINAKSIYGDKAYISESLKKEIKRKGSALVCPPKKPWKGELNLGQHLLSSLISGTRQAIETTFGWLEARTGISKANKARSEQGLLRHIFGSLVAVGLNCA